VNGNETATIRLPLDVRPLEGDGLEDYTFISFDDRRIGIPQPDIAGFRAFYITVASFVNCRRVALQHVKKRDNIVSGVGARTRTGVFVQNIVKVSRGDSR
jgi:hypothetical protein